MRRMGILAWRVGAAMNAQRAEKLASEISWLALVKTTSEVYAASLFFPITVTGRLQTRATAADFHNGRRHVGRRRFSLRRLRHNNLRGIVWGFLGLHHTSSVTNFRHGCQ